MTNQGMMIWEFLKSCLELAAHFANKKLLRPDYIWIARENELKYAQNAVYKLKECS
jgi:predicted ATPase